VAVVTGAGLAARRECTRVYRCHGHPQLWSPDSPVLERRAVFGEEYHSSGASVAPRPVGRRRRAWASAQPENRNTGSWLAPLSTIAKSQMPHGVGTHRSPTHWLSVGARQGSWRIRFV